MTIKKRDGRIVDFDETKIVNAIKKASDATSEKKLTDEGIARVMQLIQNSLKDKESDTKPIKVKEIHKMVENALMGAEFYDVARSYIEFRSNRDRERLGDTSEISFYRKKLDAKQNDRQNANVDEESFGGRNNEAAASLNKEIALNYYISPKFAKNHRDNISYEHDLSEWCVGEHNCLSLPVDQCLAKGFVVKNSDCRPAGSISSAEQLIQVLIQTQSLQQFGGVSCTHLDFTLELYVRKSFMKHFIIASLKDDKSFKSINLLQLVFDDYIDEVGVVRNAFEEWLQDNKNVFLKNWGVTFDDFYFGSKAVQRISNKWYQSAMLDTIIETKQAAEGLYHNLNTLLSRSGDQLPFSSINFGKNTSLEGKLLNESFYRASILGIGKFGRTSIFPCQIFQYDKDVNGKEGTPNYEFYQKALNSTVRRLYPNYANSNWSVQKEGIKKDRALKKEVIRSLSSEQYESLVKLFKKNPKVGEKINIEVVNNELTVTEKVQPTEDFSTMGALDGKEHLYIKLPQGIYDISIKDFYEFCKTGVLRARPCKIFFNKEELRIPGNKKVQHKSGIKVGAGVYAITYLPEDVTYIGSSKDVNRRLTEHRGNIRTKGSLDAGISFGDSDLSHYKFEVLLYTEDYEAEEKRFIETIPNVNFKGTSQKYFKTITVKGQKVYKRPQFQHDTSVAQDLIDLSSEDIKVLDRENRWVKVRHVFKNDKLNTPLMMHIYYEEQGKHYCLSCTEDHPLWTGETFTKAADLKVGDFLYRADGLRLKVEDISWHWEPVDSYDIGTETGTFIGSDIIMHNCRTNNGYDINFTKEYFLDLLTKILETGDIPDNYLCSAMQRDGRGNIAPQTIILPTVAMMAKKKSKSDPSTTVEVFMKLLEKYIEDTKDALLERFEWIASQSPNSAKFMYQNNTMKGYIPEEGIRSALKHGTLAIGQLGLAECLQILIGCDHTEERGMNLAVQIESFFKQKCDEYKEKYHLNFGVYFTPSENLCHTAYEKFVAKYGLIENVTAYRDEKIGKLVRRGYFTNSMHVPVWKKLSPFEKIDIESKLTGFSSAGCITYIELDENARHNVKAVQQIVDYAMAKDIPYFAINVPIDTCMHCGYQGVIEGDVCPNCGAKEFEEEKDAQGNVISRVLTGMIERLRRVTGYLTGSFLQYFNAGKQQEVKDRYKHSNSLQQWESEGYED